MPAVSSEARAHKRQRDRERGRAKRAVAFPCGHPRTPENTVTRPDRADACRTCKRTYDAACYRKGQPKRRPYIDAMTPVQLAEARALYTRWLAETYGTVPDSTDPAQGRFPL